MTRGDLDLPDHAARHRVASQHALAHPSPRLPASRYRRPCGASVPQADTVRWPPKSAEHRARRTWMGRLEGKVAMVTGSGGQKGFGRAIARKLASEGADLLLAD